MVALRKLGHREVRKVLEEKSLGKVRKQFCPPDEGKRIITCTDASGNTLLKTQTVKVSVPHDREEVGKPKIKQHWSKSS